jgi:hypothetical protein
MALCDAGARAAITSEDGGRRTEALAGEDGGVGAAQRRSPAISVGGRVRAEGVADAAAAPSLVAVCERARPSARPRDRQAVVVCGAPAGLEGTLAAGAAAVGRPAADAVATGEDDRAACALEEIVVEHEASVRRGYDNEAGAGPGGLDAQALTGRRWGPVHLSGDELRCAAGRPAPSGWLVSRHDCTVRAFVLPVTKRRPAPWSSARSSPPWPDPFVRSGKDAGARRRRFVTGASMPFSNRPADWPTRGGGPASPRVEPAVHGFRHRRNDGSAPKSSAVEAVPRRVAGRAAAVGAFRHRGIDGRGGPL